MFQSLSGLTLCCDSDGRVEVVDNDKTFQSLSGLTLCCDVKACQRQRPIAMFQSLSGLTLCCDGTCETAVNAGVGGFNPFQG